MIILYRLLAKAKLSNGMKYNKGYVLTEQELKLLQQEYRILRVEVITILEKE